MLLLLKRLRQAFEEVVDAVKRLRFVIGRAKMNVESELSTLQLDVDQNLEDQYLRLGI